MEVQDFSEEVQGGVLVDNGPVDEGPLEQELELVGEPAAIGADPEVAPQGAEDREVAEPTAAEQLVAALAELAALRGAPAVPPAAPAATAPGIPRNHVASKPDANRKYVRLGPLDTRGKVPLQQREVAEILVENMEIGAEWTEAEVFALLEEYGKEKASIARSVQSPSYLFRYYRGLKDDGKHAGFIARGFLRQIG